ncbi:hypothetical protein [Croceivirga sp. JEA036]|uniref:hypothetical protein n=1 Tax=Croceivirga sp. JEA036 TaxID=2721162 RepID=UPI00143A04E1|nr:hypothetical protein [Croceivirga sp. JEA036]NJB36367.1 hypothetical protein [Croceivirga sp. JEA036]
MITTQRPVQEWYLKMWQEMCPHKNDVLLVEEAFATHEVTKAHCLDCRKDFASITHDV